MKVKFLFKTFLISIVYLFLGNQNYSFAQSISQYQKNILKIIKVDTKNTGLADILIYEKPQFSIAMKINGEKVSSIEVLRQIKNIKISAIYKLNRKKYALAYAFATSSRHFFNEGTCSDHRNSFSADDWSDVSSAIEVTSNLKFGQNCSKFPELKKEISNSFTKLNSQQEKTDLVNCFSKYDIYATGKWKAMPDSLVDFDCSGSDVNYSGYFDKDKKQIVISNSCLNRESLPLVLKEELLHSFNVENENLAKCMATCPNDKSSKLCDLFQTNLLKSKTQLSSLITESNSKIAIENPDGSPVIADDYNSAKAISVPKEIAVAQVPQPAVADLKMSQSVEISTVTDTPAGGGGASASGSGAVPMSGGAGGGRASYPSSMMQFASSAILPEQAFAATNSSGTGAAAPNSDTSSSSKWTTSSSAAHAAEVYRRQAGDRSPASDSSLANPNYSASVNPVNANDGDMQSKSEKAKSARAPGRSGRTAASDGSSTSNSSSPGFSGGSGGGASAASAGAKPARSPSSMSSSNELTRYFQTAPYSEIKKRLQDPSFIQDLKKNSTTVFDTQGHQFGASQGQVIFSDKGNRFVKEK